MKTRALVSTILLGGLAWSGYSGLAMGQDLGSLKNMIGGGSSSLTSGSTGNAAGILEYCIKNNYLGGSDASAASTVKDKLMGKLGGADSAQSNSDYLAGAKGLLQSKDGKSTDLTNAGSGGAMGGMSGMSDMKSKITQKACGMVLKQGKSML